MWKMCDNAPIAINTTTVLKTAEESTPASTVGSATTAPMNVEIKRTASTAKLIHMQQTTNHARCGYMNKRYEILWLNTTTLQYGKETIPPN